VNTQGAISSRSWKNRLPLLCRHHEHRKRKKQVVDADIVEDSEDLSDTHFSSAESTKAQELATPRHLEAESKEKGLHQRLQAALDTLRGKLLPSHY
jgi:hypothetical protein